MFRGGYYLIEREGRRRLPGKAECSYAQNGKIRKFNSQLQQTTANRSHPAIITQAREGKKNKSPEAEPAPTPETPAPEEHAAIKQNT